MELEAESVAFIVCDGLDIQADAWSFGYVASWSGGGEAIAAIKAAGVRIQRAADRILSALQFEEDPVDEPVSDDGPSLVNDAKLRTVGFVGGVACPLLRIRARTRRYGRYFPSQGALRSESVRGGRREFRPSPGLLQFRGLLRRRSVRSFAPHCP